MLDTVARAGGVWPVREELCAEGSSVDMKSFDRVRCNFLEQRSGIHPECDAAFSDGLAYANDLMPNFGKTLGKTLTSRANCRTYGPLAVIVMQRC